MRRLLGRLTRANSSHDTASLPAGSRPSSSQPSPPQINLIDTLPGRLFILSSSLLLLVLAVQYVVTLPPIVVVFRRVLAAAFILSSVWLAGLLVRRYWSEFLWRVRRKLILSYLFLGLVPVVLVLILSVAAAIVLYINVAGFMFSQGIMPMRENIAQIVDTSAVEMSRNPAAAKEGLERKVANLKEQYPALSMSIVRVAPEPPKSGTSTGEPPASKLVAAAGPWSHGSPVADVPAWVIANGGFAGFVPTGRTAGVDGRLIVRAASPSQNGRLYVIADLPIDAAIVKNLQDKTGIRIDNIFVGNTADSLAPSSNTAVTRMFREAVGFAQGTDWNTGEPQPLTFQLRAPARQLYARLIADQSATLSDATITGVLAVFILAAGLLLVVQGSALFFGILLIRQITSAIHEMSVATERVRLGDFSYRIRIDSRDQLGELAENFNGMTAGLEHSRHVEREQQRLAEELRIARDIQKSLLPVEPPAIDGLTIADLCEPAREVGGDYYDFFVIGPKQLGLLVADVSGKGTSAALYMAELKGLMLSLSHAERSPRRLLITVNRLLAGHLDNRSFITMTYAIVDLEAGTLTSARAGHTPMIVVSGGESQVIAPDGMVLGLRLPGAGERFEKILQEDTRRISCGDVIVLYTDGITEAMDTNGELFGDAALARLLSNQHHLDAAGIRERVVREVRAFVGDAEPHDDMTMVVLKVGAQGIG